MKRFNVTVNGKAYDVCVEELAAGAAPAPAPASAPAPTPAPAPAAPAAKEEKAAPAPKASADALQIKCPMPGTILDVQASAGKPIKKGDIIVILEAMKMENEILAPRDGVVEAVYVQKGASVNSDDLIASLK